MTRSRSATAGTEAASAEVGSHRELMDGAGLYAELYELQARAYR